MPTPTRRSFLASSLAAACPAAGAARPDVAPAPRPARPRAIDASTLRHKVMTGYQGWFRCPGDAAGVGWRHWGRDARKLTPDTLTVEMWPDTTELTDGEKYPAPGF